MQNTPTSILAQVSEGRIKGFNEAQTRHHIIDPTLFGILGWSTDDGTVEERVTEDGENSFIDYIFRTAQTSILIEAKRLAINFGQLPNSRRISLKGSWMSGPAGDAVRQARDYARQRGVAFAAATNGDAWIVFPVNRTDGVSFEDSHAVAFQSAESALFNDFEEFSQTLSRASVIDGSLDLLLLGGQNNQTETRRLNQIYDSAFSVNAKTPLFRHIEEEIVTAFSDEILSDNPAILEKIYVTTPERTRFDERVGMTVRRREQVLKHAPIKPLSGGGLTKAVERFSSIKVKTRPSIILTLGLVGSGKTTFLHHLRHVSASSYFSDERDNRAFWIYADFRDFSSFESPRDYLANILIRYLTENIRLNSYESFISKAYAAEFDNLKRGPLALISRNKSALDQALYDHISNDVRDKHPYIEKLLRHASAKDPIFLVVDNVDQIVESHIQEAVFQESLTVSRRIGANLVLAMRDFTYLKNRHSAVFDAFDIDAIYIESPPVPAVLAARFRLAEQLVSGRRVDEITSRGARISIDDAASIVSLLRSSVLGTEVGRVIEVAAAGDIRLALRMTRNFLQYGYSSSVERYMRFNTTQKIHLATHEAIRAIMLGNSVLYRDDLSGFINPFDAKTGRTQSQFLRLYIASSLVNLAADSGFDGIDALDVIRNLEKIGFGESATESVLRDLIEGRMLITHSGRPYSRDAVLSPTTFAGYVVREMISTFVYLETTLYDTFISDDTTWKTVRDAFRQIYSERNPVQRLAQRKLAVAAFFDFCRTSFEPLVVSAQRHGLPPAWLANPFERNKAAFAEELTRVMRSGRRTGRDDRDAPV